VKVFLGLNVGRGSTKCCPCPAQTRLKIWWRECETINQEMESLILPDWPRSHEDNQVRRIQFMALVERRSEAARRFLSDAALRFSRDSIAIDEPRPNSDEPRPAGTRLKDADG
jgi:hypothetical protein